MPEHVAFDELHHALQVVDFDWEQVFSDLDEPLAAIRQASPSAREEAAELFRRLATWCFKGQCRPRTALVRFIAIVSGLRPDLLNNMSGSKLSRQLGVTKQAISHQSVKFEDAFQIKFARSRSKEGRARMASARRGGPNRNLGQHHEIADTSNRPA